MTTEIDQLHLQLPAGFGPRAQRIARLVGAALAGRELPPGRIAHLRIGPLNVDARRSDRALAAQIAGAIQSAVHPQGR